MFHLLAPIHTSLGLVVGLVGSLIGLDRCYSVLVADRADI